MPDTRSHEGADDGADEVRRTDASPTESQRHANAERTAFQDMARWPSTKDQAEGLISTAFVDRVTKDLEFVEPTPGVKKPDPILVADKVTRRFGGMTALDVDHFEIERHGITALIGPNGAGKTTFFNLMTGFDTPNTGSWNFDGVDLARVSPEQVARKGMVRTFQLTKVMNRLTVMDNMLLGSQRQKGEGMLRSLVPGLWKTREAEIAEQASELLKRFLLWKKKDDYAGSLSGGQRKLLEMARALMSNPKLVMLDEPMAGVNPALKQSLLDHILSLREEGTTVLFVEHDMNMVRHIADWVTVMAEGKIVAEGKPAEVMNDQAVIDAYLGSHANIDLGDIPDSVVSEEGAAQITNGIANGIVDDSVDGSVTADDGEGPGAAATAPPSTDGREQ